MRDSLRSRMRLLWADSSTVGAGVSSLTTLRNFGLGGCSVTLGGGCCTWGFTFLRKMLARRSSAAAVDLSFSDNGAFGAGFWSAAINRALRLLLSRLMYFVARCNCAGRI